MTKSLALAPVFVVICALSSGMPAYANNFIEFQHTNMQVLYGTDYELGRVERTIVTLEHANRWRYGDFYGFTDLTLNDDLGIYAEVSPRLSLNDLGLFAPSDGRLFGDLYITTNLELLTEGRRRYAYGLGTDLRLPGFAFFKVNLMQRNDPNLSGDTCTQ